MVLKELKECGTALKIIIKKQLIKPVRKLTAIFGETEELIVIFAKGIDTPEKDRETPGNRKKLNIEP